MSRWLRFSRVRCVVTVVQPRKFHSRLLSTRSSVEHVRVPCASAGAITVSLHNIAHHDTSSPLVILIPPFSQPGPDPVTPLPSCFHDYPTAVIHYRWQVQEEDEQRPEFPLHWPTPLHDINFGYSWIVDNLGSGTDLSTEPRPAYVYGSYLGASLAAGLALTESHVPARSQPMTVRGLMAHNGIYNWTMFLPDHPIHKLKAKPNSNRKRRGLQLPFASACNDDHPVEEEGIFTDLKHLTPDLFADPSNLFDPFASACLFFHSANLHVPDDFTTPLSATPPPTTLTAEFTAAINALANHSSTSPSPPKGEQEEDPTDSAADLLTKAAHLAKQQKPPRKGYLVFPPRHNSTLRLPATLLIHSSQPQPTTPPHSRKTRKPRNSFAVQASELAGLMLRSLDMHEFRSRRRRGGGPAPWEWEAEEAGGGESAEQEEWERWRGIERRVQSLEVEAPRHPGLGEGEEEDLDGMVEGGLGLGLDEKGEEAVGEWLRERIDEDFGGEGEGA